MTEAGALHPFGEQDAIGVGQMPKKNKRKSYKKFAGSHWPSNMESGEFFFKKESFDFSLVLVGALCRQWRTTIQI